MDELWTRDRSTMRLEAARREASWPIDEGITESVRDREDGGQEPTAPASASVH